MTLARVLLIDPDERERKVLGERLRLQGFVVVESSDGSEGAISALEHPPAAVIADLSMPSISGVQLCRLLGAEPATRWVPVILRGPEGRRNRFWAEQAGALAYVVKGRMGELVRALRRAIDRSLPVDPHHALPSGTAFGHDVRERIAGHLDAALFDSVVAAEIRRLGTSESFERLVDSLSQFLSQVTTYRWVAVMRTQPATLGLHCNPAIKDQVLAEACAALRMTDPYTIVTVEDDDAVADREGPSAICEGLPFGDRMIGAIALAPRAPVHQNDPLLVRTIARELGGALRMASLVEESRMMASVDALTSVLNRRAFIEWAAREVKRSLRYKDPFSLLMLDIDHFKGINDSFGHATGDAVLSAAGKMMSSTLRSCDVIARWGGEEFVVALPSTGVDGAHEVAERLRRRFEQLAIENDGNSVPTSASFGVVGLHPGETLEQCLERADLAMYAAKHGGRNRVVVGQSSSDVPAPHVRAAS